MERCSTDQSLFIFVALIIPAVTIRFDHISGLIRLVSSTRPRTHGTTGVEFELLLRDYDHVAQVFAIVYIRFKGDSILQRPRIQPAQDLLVIEVHIEHV